MQKIYYDATANKEVVDVSGIKDEGQVKAEFGLGNSTQIVEIDESFEATGGVNGTLQKFDAKARGEQQRADNEAAAKGKKTAALAKLNQGRNGPPLTEDDLEDLGI